MNVWFERYSKDCASKTKNQRCELREFLKDGKTRQICAKLACPLLKNKHKQYPNRMAKILEGDGTWEKVTGGVAWKQWYIQQGAYDFTLFQRPYDDGEGMRVIWPFKKVEDAKTVATLMDSSHDGVIGSKKGDK